VAYIQPVGKLQVCASDSIKRINSCFVRLHNDNNLKDAHNTTVTVLKVLLLATAPVLLVPCDSESLP
jgi:hypothetical protein